MPVLAGWLTGEQVPAEMIEQVLRTMETVLGRHGGQPARNVQPGAGILAIADSAFATRQRLEPPVLDWSPDRRTLVYRRPLSGAHPLYYIEDWPAHGNLLFASEIKALFAAGAPRRLHLPALDALLRYGFIPAPWTAFQDIHVVPAGSLLRWQRSKTIVNTAIDYHFEAPLSPDNTLEQFHTLLDSTVDALLPPHDQFVALTRANSSSALALALAAQHTTTPFTVATLGYKKFAIQETWDRVEQFADKYQCPFLAIEGVDQPDFWLATLNGLEAPCVDSRPLLWHQLLHTVSEQTGARVALTGQGATTLTGASLRRFEQALRASSNEREAGEHDILREYALLISSSSLLATTRLWSAEARQLLEQGQSWEETLHARKLARQAEKFPREQQRWHYLDLHLRLSDQLIGPIQQLATAERMALRSPYLTPDVMQMLVRLPTSQEDDTPGLNMIDMLAHKYVPDELLRGQNGRPQGIAPTESLLHVEDSELLQQVLSPEAVRAMGIFEPGIVQEVLSRDGQMGVASRELLLVFTTQLLCKLFEVGI
ncbi:MAG TPA: asparagine synthase-related protein [Ktedonobacteraceae bacterium]|nr:asparagine synthase-related protein [Ktedonobacteraceae bacterium]